MKKIIINENDSGQRLDKFLSKTFKNLPASLMYKSIRKKNIKLNGSRCKISDKLKFQDEIELYLNDEFLDVYNPYTYEFLKAPLKLNILYEDDNILIINKKPGVIIHPDKNYHFDSLLYRLQHYLYKKGEYNPKDENSFSPAFANRIDRNTGGIVIAAKNAESLRILNQKIKDREIDKFYLCEIMGHLKIKESTLKAYLKKNESKNKVFLGESNLDNKKEIITNYKVLKEMQNSSLLEIKLITGRTHQIRAHLAYIGHPLLGDKKYSLNNKQKNNIYKYQALYSYKVVFNFITNSGILEYLNSKEFEINPKNIWFIKDTLEE